MPKSRSDVLVFFGATGDLAYKKIFPALYAMTRDDKTTLPVIGVAYSGWDVAKLRDRATDSIRHAAEAAGDGVDADVLAALLARLSYVDGDYNDASTFTAIKTAMGTASAPLHYLAIPPSLFGIVVKHLAASGCANDARVVVEKPFGRDLASARELNATLHGVFDEAAIFRIDHYLGKEAVQNLLYLRFANSVLEPVWNREHIDCVQITMAEAFGVDGRGAFYDGVGTIRDVLQNHLLQVVSLLAMNAPVSSAPADLNEEKLRIFRGMRPVIPSQVIRGQFEGYRDIDGVAEGSDVETFVALCLHIDTWRWAGVPFYLRAGKRLPITATQVVVDMKPPPLAIFDPIHPPESNYFRFRLSPEVVLAQGMRVKRHGDDMAGEAVEMIARHRHEAEKSPYQRLLGDAIDGDNALFTSDACVEAAWAVVDRILAEPSPVQPYAPGTWGPEAAMRVVTEAEGWHEPVAEESSPC